MRVLCPLFLFLNLLNPASCATQENFSNSVSVPDYSKWQLTSETAEEFLYKKEAVLLVIKIFNYVDGAGMRHSVATIDDLKQKPWLLFYGTENMLTKDRAYYRGRYVFEQNNGKWVPVKDLSNSQDMEKDGEKLLKERYDLIHLH